MNVSWDLPRILLAVAAFVGLRLKVNILWVVLIGTTISVLDLLKAVDRRRISGCRPGRLFSSVNLSNRRQRPASTQENDHCIVFSVKTRKYW